MESERTHGVMMSQGRQLVSPCQNFFSEFTDFPFKAQAVVSAPGHERSWEQHTSVAFMFNPYSLSDDGNGWRPVLQFGGVGWDGVVWSGGEVGIRCVG